jgi:hypothetical protein
VDIRKALGIDLNRYNIGIDYIGGTDYMFWFIIGYSGWISAVYSGCAFNGSCKFILRWFLNVLSLSLSVC